jgi:putative ABC transport system substrate-binding protein
MEELVRLPVDVIVCTGGPGVGAAMGATDTIAIVGLADDILDSGHVDTLNRPGRNLTGIGDQGTIHGKRLQLLKEAVPGLARVAVLGYRTAASPGPPELLAAAETLRLDLVWAPAHEPEDLDSAFETILRRRAKGLYVLATHVNSQHATRIAKFAASNLLPTISASREGAWLLSYDSDYSEKMRRAAVLTKKILDGAKPSELPFEQPTKYLLVIDLNTAREIRVTIPQSLLVRADELVH